MTENKFVVFENPGEIDLRAITTMGVNVKDGEAIGQFGTGLKYAIAGVLRLGGAVGLAVGGQKILFGTDKWSIRGKDFSVVNMTSKEGSNPIGFTTELGKHWEPWMLYRELLSNTLDEGGEVYETAELPREVLGKTIFFVQCQEISAIHAARNAFWISSERAPLWADETVEIYEGKSTSLFYRGIQAWNSPKEAPWGFTYNLLEEQSLTEDRSFKSIYEVKTAIAKALLRCDSKELIAEAVPQNQEYHLDYDRAGFDVSEEFIDWALGRLRGKKAIPSSVKDMLDRERESQVKEAEALQVPETFEEMLEAEPKVETEIKSSYYTYVRECDSRIEELEANCAFWKKCAEVLAERLRVPDELELQAKHEALTPLEAVGYEDEAG